MREPSFTFSNYVRQCMETRVSWYHISHLFHGGFDASRMAARQMAGLMEGLSRGMTRFDLCCIWEISGL